MLTKGAIEDLIFGHLSRDSGGGAAAPAERKVRELGKKVFLSDWELRRLYKPGSRSVDVPANALISPLSGDWLDYDGIEARRSLPPAAGNSEG